MTNEATKTENGTAVGGSDLEAVVMPLAVTVAESGDVEREHHDGFDFPGGYDFTTVNNFVHHQDTAFEELQWMCLGMATEIGKLRKRLDTAKAAMERSEGPFYEGMKALNGEEA